MLRLTFLIPLLLVGLLSRADDLRVYLNPAAPLEERVDDALRRMTRAEKIGIIHAQSKFSSRGVPRLGIPELWTTDGPHGIRPEVVWDEWRQAGWTNDSCTAFPALTCLAATWNPSLARLYGQSIGEEALYRGKDVVLGPGVNLYRTPLCGRNFEYMGEDPYLASRMVVPYVEGVQANGVAACVKHFALNNNEHERNRTNVLIDDRALYELYLPAFKAAVTEGHAWSIMAAYNLIDGAYCCAGRRLLTDILKCEWGFDGAVVSDWGGAHDTRDVVLGGLDLEFGTNVKTYDDYHLALPYQRMIERGELTDKELDDKARRVLRLMMRTSMRTDKPLGSMNSEAHNAACRRIGGEGIVLLKNDKGLLPIDTTRARRILVVGENAIKMMTVGGGSSSLKAQHEVSPLEGIREAAGSSVMYARGYVGDPTGECDGVTGRQSLADERTPEALTREAVERAREADVVIYIGGLNKGGGQDCEGTDRKSLALPYAQDALITALAQANPKLVVVNVSGNAVAMPWADRVPAILQAWYLGSEAGHALSDVLFGRVNPSGRLPFTFPRELSDVAAHHLNAYPGVKRRGEDGRTYWDETYSEGLLVGYRWHDTKGIRPLFAFGHGLSYTTFKYGHATLSNHTMTPTDTLTLTVNVTNTGRRAGAETVQLYISDDTSLLPRPAKELRGFQKVALAPGETQTVTFPITRASLSFFDPAAHTFRAEAGTFHAHVAAAADDIRTTVSFRLE